MNSCWAIKMVTKLRVVQINFKMNGCVTNLEKKIKEYTLIACRHKKHGYRLFKIICSK